MCNIEVLKKTIQDLKESWTTALLASIPLNFLPTFILLDHNLGLLSILVLSGPLRVGLSKTTLKIANKETVQLSYIFDGFKYFKHSLGVFLLSILFIGLGLICFIIPGILIAIWLSQSFFILSENPHLEPLDIFKKSKEIIKGHELKYLISFVSFLVISLILIQVNLLFISLLLVPLQYVYFSNFYNVLKKK